MKSTALRLSLIALFVGFFATPAFAIDQVRLTNGEVLEGTVLNDVTNLHVDIRLVNGNTRRIPHNEVASVDRDVPSRKDKDLYSQNSVGFVALTAGGSYQTESPGGSSSVLFDYGVKAGIVASYMESSKFAVALSFDRNSTTTTTLLGDYTNAYNDLNVQFLLTRINNGGFYIGPNVGLAILSTSSPAASHSDSRFEAGIGLGYEFYLSDGFSIGPDVRYEHIFLSGTGANFIKFALAGTFHL